MQKTSGASRLNAQLKTARTGLLPRASFGYVNDRSLPSLGNGDPPLHMLDRLAGVALVPAPVEVFGDGAQLDNQIMVEILGLDLAALLAPQPDQMGLVIASSVGHRLSAIDSRSPCNH
jgi:hypothetical protein